MQVAGNSATIEKSRNQLKLYTLSTFGAAEWIPMEKLIEKESGFDPQAVNSSSGACGLGQFLPCSKLLDPCGSLDNIPCQVAQVMSYIEGRYKTPSAAWEFWQNNGYY